MSWFGEQWRRLQFWWQKDQMERELSDEMEEHRQLRARRLLREGANDVEAEFAARRRFGNSTLFAEDSRAEWGWRLLDRFSQDVRFAMRQLRSNPGFALSAIASLALGIGSAVLVFAVLYSVVLRPFPFPESEKLAFVWINDAQREIREEGTSYATFQDWKTQNRTFSGIAARGRGFSATLNGPEPERVLVDVVSASFIPVMGVAPIMGRTFTQDEEDKGVLVVVISHRLALRRFGSPQAAVGAAIELDGRMWQICGVMPPKFGIPPARQDVWMPARSQPQIGKSVNQRSSDFFMGIGRLSSGVSAQAAENDLNRIGQQLAREYPNPDPEFGGYGVAVVPFDQQVLGSALPRTLWTLLAAVGLVLLVACVNVANLLLARGSARRAEFSLRAALGADTKTLVSQQLTESLILSMVATVIGIGLAALALRILPVIAPGDLPRFADLTIQPQVATFAVLICGVAAILFGAVPAWLHSRRDPQEGMQAASSRVTDRGASRVQTVFVVLECALAFVLVSGAALFVQSFTRVKSVNPGFDATNTFLFRVGRGMSQRPAPAPVILRNLFVRLRQLPGVDSVGAIGEFFFQRNADYIVTVQGRATESKEQVTVDGVTPGFLETVRVRLLRGRSLTDADYQYADFQAGRPATLVINETFARRFFPNESPLGKHLKFGAADAKGPWIEVVGVVADLHRRGLERQAVCEAFGPLSQDGMDIVVRMKPGNTSQLIPAIRDTVREVEPGAYVYGVTSIETRLQELAANRRLQAWSLSGLAFLTLLLAAVGIGGVMQYTVNQQRRELAIRSALGADGGKLSGAVLGRAVRNTLIAELMGVAFIAALARTVASLLFGVSPLDPATLLLAALVLISVALAACWVPARAACRTNMATLLRD